MNKKNQKGFMLVELIVTSTIVISAMVILYANFNRIYSLYKEKNNYYNIDGIYATKEMTKNLLQANFNKFIVEALDNSNNYKYIIEKQDCTQFESINNNEICTALRDLYSINNMLFTEYDKSALENLKENADIPSTFKDYLSYIMEYYNITNSETSYSYIILTETEEKGTYYYSNLRIRW